MSEQSNIADSLIEQAKSLIEAATGTPGAVGKREFYEAAEAAFRASELARRREIDQLNAEIDGEVFLLPRDHYKFVLACHKQLLAAIGGRRS